MTEDMRRYQDDLFKEWYDEIKEECGLDNAAERFRKIIEYYITCSVSNFLIKKILVQLSFNFKPLLNFICSKKF